MSQLPCLLALILACAPTLPFAEYLAPLGRYAGSWVGNSFAGRLDMPGAVQALKRGNGEYLVPGGEDWRGKNLLQRWTP